jgi:hypothetical protein
MKEITETATPTRPPGTVAHTERIAACGELLLEIKSELDHVGDFFACGNQPGAKASLVHAARIFHTLTQLVTGSPSLATTH